jgi:multisubunit Na+/H+ antiporter MnhG subunit
VKTFLVEGLLALAVLGAWIGALGFLRLKTALDRLHVSTFVLAASGAPLTLAAFVEDGVSQRSLKFAFLFATLLFAGAATSHAVGRALFTRDGDRA